MFNRKDFLGLKDMNTEEILHILSTADTMKYLLAKKNKRSPHLQGKSVALMFYEKSSRTRVSYELAAKHLSANVVDMGVTENMENTETLADMGRIVDQMGADFIILRHGMAGTAKMLSENVTASVINAGDGLNENPSQALMDMMAIKDKKGGFENLKVAMVGDIAHNRVARSSMWALLKLGAEVVVGAPPTLIPAQLDTFGIKIYFNIREAVKDSDVIMTYGLRTDRQDTVLVPSLNEYKHLFQVDMDTLSLAKKDAIIMHPGAIKRDVEVSSQIIDSKQCLVNDQITNGVAVRMALLYLLSVRGGISL